MKKIVSKIMVTLILCITFATALFIKDIYATNKIVNIKVTTSANSVVVGDLITVTIGVSSDIQIMYGSFMLNYDSSMFDFVSVDGATGSGYAGVIPFRLDTPIDMENIGKPTSYEYVVVLKAKNTVDATDIFVSDIEFTGIDENVEEYFLKENVTNAGKIKIWAEGSDDATLNSLQVVGTTLTPAFSKWTMAYTAYVGTNTTVVDVAAASTQGGRVEIAGNTTNLVYGNNIIIVTSYAPNGKAMQYTINVVRPEPVTEPPTTIPEPTTLPPEWTEIVINGISYNITSEYPNYAIPAGFEAAVYDYKNNQILAVTNSKSGMDLIYLVDGMGNGKFFVYDSDKDVFYDYVQVDSVGSKYVIVPMDNAKIIPPDATEGKATINGYETDVYIDNNNKDFAYFYAVNNEGVYGWYSYDMVENTIQRYVFESEETESETGTVEEETTSYSEETTEEYITTTEQEGDTSYDWMSENESLKAANVELTNIRNIAIIVAGVLLVILVALVVVLLVHSSEKKHAIDMDDVDYADLEEDDEDEDEDNEDSEDNEEEKDTDDKADNALNECAATVENTIIDEAIANSLSKAKMAAESKNDDVLKQQDKNDNKDDNKEDNKEENNKENKEDEAFL